MSVIYNSRSLCLLLESGNLLRPVFPTGIRLLGCKYCLHFFVCDAGDGNFQHQAEAAIQMIEWKEANAFPRFSFMQMSSF